MAEATIRNLEIMSSYRSLQISFLPGIKLLNIESVGKESKIMTQERSCSHTSVWRHSPGYVHSWVNACTHSPCAAAMLVCVPGHTGVFHLSLCEKHSRKL